jgi:hypothetical protein
MSHRHPHHADGYAPAEPDPELAEILQQICGQDGAFRHRQHINLAFIAVCRYGMPAAGERVCSWIKQIAAYERAPQKYHETVSRAWVDIVAHHVAADPTRQEFDHFAQANPALFEKRLLSQHYSSSALSAASARHAYAAPDLLPFPWAA